MKLQKGDILVFKGSSERVEHFKNFNIGDRYTVSDITTLSIDVEDYNPIYQNVVLFEGFIYGVYLFEIDRCFESIEEHRNRVLTSLEL